MKCANIFLLCSAVLLQTVVAQELFTQKGTDPTFEELVKRKKLPDGRSSKEGVTGSKVKVDNRLVEITPEAKRPIASDIKIHTLANSAVPRGDFENWSRWYQEDSHTQIFRLFKGETNVHNDRENAARIEAFSTIGWKKGDWHEWSGTYTLIKPIGAMIFQVKNDKNDWAVSLLSSINGSVKLNHRRGGKDTEIANNMIGKPFHIRVRDNGHDYEVFLDGKKVGDGFYDRPAGTTNFRWGMYVGGNTVTQDGMIFVSGATIDGKPPK
jgi:hypothetical protein